MTQWTKFGPKAVKRDMDLVRDILLQVEQSGDVSKLEIEVDDIDKTVFGYHQHIIIDAGLAEGVDQTNLGHTNPQARITSPTWKGHEFLDAARDPSTWENAKDRAGKVGGVSLQVMTSILTELVRGELQDNSGLQP